MSTRAERGLLRVRLVSWGLAYTPAAALAVLLPKCPLCIAAQLALIGVTIPLPSYARWLAIAFSVVLGTAVLLLRRKRAIACAHCVPRAAESCAGDEYCIKAPEPDKGFQVSRRHGRRLERERARLFVHR